MGAVRVWNPLEVRVARVWNQEDSRRYSRDCSLRSRRQTAMPQTEFLSLLFLFGFFFLLFRRDPQQDPQPISQHVGNLRFGLFFVWHCELLTAYRLPCLQSETIGVGTCTDLLTTSCQSKYIVPNVSRETFSPDSTFQCRIWRKFCPEDLPWSLLP